MPKSKLLIFIIGLCVAITSCAKRGSITGGLKDTIPPTIVKSTPKNMSTNFTGSEIRIDFDEYVKIKDVNKQLIISPPLKNQPFIMPAGSASKFIKISIKDTLQPNTTYSFNFGQSITDNNEGNPYSQFRFIFSTGSYIDSLSQSGSIKDAYNRENDNFVTVMLYEANETFNDSTIYKQKPRYVTNTLDSAVVFSLQNLKAGKYHLFALKDVGSNYLFNPKTDKLAFLNKTITVPSDTLHQLKLFKEKGRYKAVKPTQASSNRLFLGYEGKDPKGIKVDVKNGTGTTSLATTVTTMRGKDSLQVWLPREVKDSLQVKVTKNDVVNDFVVKIKEMKAADSLTVDAVQRGGLHFREKFTLNPSTPLVNIDASKITLVDKDSIAVPFTHKYDDFNNELVFDFKKDENQKYNFVMMPGAMTDFYGKANDTLNYKLTTRSYADYGNLQVNLENVKRFPAIVEITDAKGKVYASHYTESETKIYFDAVMPSKYVLRIIYDDNKNREWDTGDYLNKIQPEEVIYFPKEIDVRANWDVEQPFPAGG
ncbi:hypothetical protein GR160_08775 [Flavobacterium sp. Sd200]|uniref:Ig-like domain-containing protein n=1 Tax=Flavobacterium sp. Sd200 TaxID=2692211 RepID=UPI00136D2475|nr:Ig-like domain-containing protein [Flavobacterium sp. Sd200]MXN91321.1 hypothetical protein [Flavobacterium sp. Sd200]